MTEWFVVNLLNPRASTRADADNVIAAVVQMMSGYGMRMEPGRLEAAVMMHPARFAVWRTDALSEAPMLVRERCA